MANTTLYIRLGSAPDSPPAWFAQAPGHRPQRGTGLDGAAAAAAARVVVLVPGGELLLTRAELPAVQRRRLLQAVPYALEEQLAEEVEQLHFAVGAREADGAVPVAVVARARMDEWLGTLAAAGVQPGRLLPETLALPWEPGSWTVLLEDGSALLRTGAESGYAFEPELLAAVLPHALGRERERPALLRVYDCRGSGAGPELTDLCAALELPLERPPCPEGALGLLAFGASGGGLDLLQGEYSRGEQLGRRWRPWLPAAAMLCSLLLVQAGLTLADYLRLARQEADLTARIEQVYREAFPDAKRVVNPRVQMEQALTRLKGGGGQQELTYLLTRAGPVLSQAPGLQLKGLRYREGEMELDIALADLAGLDRLKESLLGEGRLDTDIQNANSRGDSVEARLVLRRRAGT